MVKPTGLSCTSDKVLRGLFRLCINDNPKNVGDYIAPSIHGAIGPRGIDRPCGRAASVVQMYIVVHTVTEQS